MGTSGTPMALIAKGLGILMFSSAAYAAGELVCADNRTTGARMCFHKDKVRANENVRSSPFYTGGPLQLDDTGYTVRVHCVSKVLELADRKGITFVRNVPTEQVGLDFVINICSHSKLKMDKTLRLN